MKALLLAALIAPLWGQTAVDVKGQIKFNGQTITLALFFSGSGAPAAALCPTPPDTNGRLYVDTSAGQLWFCSLGTWRQVPLAVAAQVLPHVDTFAPLSATSPITAQTYTTTVMPLPAQPVIVYVNGLVQTTPGDYTITGQTVTFAGSTATLLGATVKLQYWAAQ